jgi:hypothetical protein
MMATTGSTAHATAATTSPSDSTLGIIERRFESRESVRCDLWMIDHHGSTVLRCQCVEVSPGGMRLRVPLGYGVAEGQRYELRSHLPGARPASTLGLVGSRWATVVRTQLHIDEGEDHLDVGVVLDAMQKPVTRVVN